MSHLNGNITDRLNDAIVRIESINTFDAYSFGALKDEMVDALQGVSYALAEIIENLNGKQDGEW